MQNVSIIEHTNKLLKASKAYDHFMCQYQKMLSDNYNDEGSGWICLELKLIIVIYLKLMDCHLEDFNPRMSERILKVSDYIKNLDLVRNRWKSVFDDGDMGLTASLIRRGCLMSSLFEEKKTYFNINSLTDILESYSGDIWDMLGEQDDDYNVDPFETMYDMDSHISIGNPLLSYIETMSFSADNAYLKDDLISLYGELEEYFPQPETAEELKVRDKIILCTLYVYTNYDIWSSSVAEAFLVKCRALDEYCHYRDQHPEEIEAFFSKEDRQITSIISTLHGYSDVSDFNNDAFCFTRLGGEYLFFFSYVYSEEEDNGVLYRSFNPTISLLLREVESYLDAAKEKLNLQYHKQSNEWLYNTYIAFKKQEKGGIVI